MKTKKKKQQTIVTLQQRLINVKTKEGISHKYACVCECVFASHSHTRSTTCSQQPLIITHPVPGGQMKAAPDSPRQSVNADSDTWSHFAWLVSHLQRLCLVIICRYMPSFQPLWLPGTPLMMEMQHTSKRAPEAGGGW